MPYYVTKIFKFEMAHILSKSYSTECQRVHGHSYKLEVTVGLNNAEHLNADGMVCDFKRLKEVIEPFISILDHNCISEEDIGYNPTAENMADHIFRDFSGKLKTLVPGVYLSKLRLWETDTSYVTIER